MITYLVKRLLIILLTLLVMSVVIFSLVELMPGDVAQIMLGQNATPQALAALRQSMGLDEPPVLRYLSWISGVALGDFGDSLYMQNVSIASLIGRRFFNSFVLAMFALLLYVPTSIFLGVLAGWYHDRWPDQIISFFGLAVMAIPEFVSGIFLITILALQLNLLPVSSVIPLGETLLENFSIVVLPALSITFVMLGYVARMQRASMVATLRSDYIKAAILKGVPQRQIMFRHALRNALLPTITIIGMNMGWLFGGLIVVEHLFSFPGFGSLTFSAVKSRDLPLIEACVLIITAVYLVSIFITDTLYGVLNPRIRLTTGGRR